MQNEQVSISKPWLWVQRGGFHCAELGCDGLRQSPAGGDVPASGSIPAKAPVAAVISAACLSTLTISLNFAATQISFTFICMDRHPRNVPVRAAAQCKHCKAAEGHPVAA